jgi:26S proteasome regulatory subunit N1
MGVDDGEGVYNMPQLPVTVRVGQAVETVGQAGRPKTISGFQTHTTPVPLAATERAEIAGDEHLVTGAYLEGIVRI